MAGYSKKTADLARFYERTDHASVEANTLQLLKANYRIALFVSAGFLAGFAACYCWQHQASEAMNNASADQTLWQPFPNVVASATNQTFSAEVPHDTTRFFAGDNSIVEAKQSLFTGAKTKRWRVTVWYPTIPPQRAGEFDPLEDATKRLIPKP
jgi:hypothetical protein